MRLAVLLALALATIGVPASAAAADMCNAIALVDVPDWGDGVPADASGGVLKRGEIDEAVTQYQVDKKTGEGVFCSHGGYCYPRYLTRNGRRVEALRLTNCKIGAAVPSSPGIDDNSVIYDIDVDRSKNSASALKKDDVDNALLNIGMCNACADNAADFYIRHPGSQCGAKVARALAGDKEAIIELRSNPDYCNQSAPIAAPSPSAAVNDNAAVATATPETTIVRLSQPHSKPISMLKMGLIIAAILYFVPAVVAFVRHKRNAPAILALNLFLGWSFLGWVAALIWSLLADAPRDPNVS